MTASPKSADFLDELKDVRLASAIDLMRWLAAFIVVISHARFPLLKGYGLLPPDERPLWVQGWYFATGYFVEAVLIFFVLSGFLVGGMACARLRRGTFDAKGYAIDRTSRLYTAYLPALLLTVALTAIGQHWFNATGLYDASNATFAEKSTVIDFAANTGWGTFLGNLAMLQSYFVEPYGSNPPLWTLSSEFWFYVTFGLLAAAVPKSGGMRLVLCGIALIAALLLGPMFLLYLAMWLTGLAAALIRPPKWHLTPYAIMLLVALLLARRLGDATLMPSDAARFFVQLLISMATGLLLLGWRARPPGWAKPLARFNRFMADFSFSLYLTHFPVMILLVAILGSWTGNPGYQTGFSPVEPAALATYAAELTAAFTFAWMFAQLTERNTGKLRKWLHSALPSKWDK